jgi:phosphate transport system protein
MGVPAKDPEMDRLYRELLAEAIDPSWPYGVAAAIDVCLLGRFYDRFADHAAGIADRVIYQVTGQTRQVDTA